MPIRHLLLFQIGRVTRGGRIDLVLQFGLQIVWLIDACVTSGLSAPGVRVGSGYSEALPTRPTALGAGSGVISGTVRLAPVGLMGAAVAGGGEGGGGGTGTG